MPIGFEAATPEEKWSSKALSSEARLALVQLLLEPGWFSGDPVYDARGRFALALALQAGPTLRAMVSMCVANWRPGRREVVDCAPLGHYGRLFDARRRLVPLTPTLKLLGDHYLAVAGLEDPDASLFGVACHNVLVSCQKAACLHIGSPDAVSLGDAGAIFARRLLNADRDDGLAEHLVGLYRHHRFGGYGVDHPPPDAVARRFLADRLPWATPWPGLTAPVQKDWIAGRRQRRLPR